MMVMNEAFGATNGATEVVKEKDGSMQTVSPGNRLNRYPWERQLKERNRLQRLRAQHYPAPIRYGAQPVASLDAVKARTLINMARHGADPVDEPQMSIAEMLNFVRGGNTEMAVKEEVLARRRAVGNMVEAAGEVDSKHAIDTIVRGHVSGAATMALQFMRGQGKTLKSRRRVF